MIQQALFLVSLLGLKWSKSGARKNALLFGVLQLKVVSIWSEILNFLGLRKASMHTDSSLAIHRQTVTGGLVIAAGCGTRDLFLFETTVFPKFLLDEPDKKVEAKKTIPTHIPSCSVPWL